MIQVTLLLEEGKQSLALLNYLEVLDFVKVKYTTTTVTADSVEEGIIIDDTNTGMPLAMPRLIDYMLPNLSIKQCFKKGRL